MSCQPFHSKDGNDVTETYCSDQEWKNSDVNIGSWVNTNAQSLDFTFQLEVPLNEDNAMYIAGLYFDYADYDPTYDYETYMTKMDELSKYEVHFKCVKEPSPEPVSDNPITIEENHGITTVSMVDNSDTAVGFSRNLSCESGTVQRKIVSISGFGEEYCEMIGNYAQFVYRKISKFIDLWTRPYVPYRMDQTFSIIYALPTTVNASFLNLMKASIETISWITIMLMTNIAVKKMGEMSTGEAWTIMLPLISDSVLLLKTTITTITVTTMIGFRLPVLKSI